MIFIKHLIYNCSDCLGKIFFEILFFYSDLYQCFLISIHFCLVCKLVSIVSFTTSQFTFTFFTMFGIFRKSLILGLQKGSGKTEKLCRGFLKTLLGKANPYSCYNVLNFYFYIFKNLIDIIIDLDILLSFIGTLFSYLFLSCFMPLRYLLLPLFVIMTTFYNVFITTILHFQNGVRKILIQILISLIHHTVWLIIFSYFIKRKSFLYLPLLAVL